MPTKIAIIDDDLELLELVEMVLSEEGYEVATCSNAEAAFRLVKDWQPDVILLDIHMPERSGWELFELLKLDSATRQTPVLFVTGYEDEVHAARRWLDRWRAGTLIKPFEIDQLLAKVKRLAT